MVCPLSGTDHARAVQTGLGRGWIHVGGGRNICAAPRRSPRPACLDPVDDNAFVRNMCIALAQAAAAWLGARLAPVISAEHLSRVFGIAPPGISAPTRAARLTRRVGWGAGTNDRARRRQGAIL